MVYLPPFVVHGTYLLTDRELEECAGAYRNLLEQLTKGGTELRDILDCEYLNDWLQAGKETADG
jgi:glutathione-regulated potassium-efflux system ancillary protein KefG